VEVSLIGEPEIQKAISAKQKMLARQEALLLEQVEKAQSQLDVAKQCYSVFEKTNSPATRKEYLSAKEEWRRLIQQGGNAERGPVLIELITHYETTTKETETKLLDAIEAATEALAQAQKKQASVPSRDLFSVDFAPLVVRKVTTDADGKFEISVPAKGRFAIFARASRQIGNVTERYDWLFWLPPDRPSQILLSNNNVINSEYSGNVLPQQMEREMAVNRTTTISAESIGLINNTNDDEIGAFGFKTGAQIDGRFTQSKDDDSYNCLLQCSTNGFWQLRLSPQQNRTGTEFNLEPFTTVYKGYEGG